jgi:Tfp pilus assembly protein PilO
MKGSDKAIVLGVVMAVVLVGFYLTVLAPKRNQASQLGKDVDALKAQVAQQEQTAQFGEQARNDFPLYYGRLVVLGKAVPDQADTSSLMVELSAISRRTGVSFGGITLNTDAGTSGATSTPPPSGGSTAPSTGTSGSSSSTAGASGSTSGTSTTPTTVGSSTSSGTSGSSTAAPAAATSAPATETSAANLPIGASVGPDSLAVMPYSLDFNGSYFQVADFLKGLDDLIHVHGNSTVAADGRLLTIDGFSLSRPQSTSTGSSGSGLTVSVAVTSYVTPSSEGLTAGASPSGPSSVGTTPTQPASAPVGTP